MARMDDEDLEDFGQMAISPLMMLLGLGALIGGVLFIRNRAEAQAGVEKLELSVNVQGGKPALENQKKLARALIDGLASACPGAPTLNKVIRRKPVIIENGLRIVYTFDANFAGEFDPANPFVRKAVGECMFAFIKKNAAFGSRIEGIRAKRIA